jgi:hypothetical protein
VLAFQLRFLTLECFQAVGVIYLTLQSLDYKTDFEMISPGECLNEEGLFLDRFSRESGVSLPCRLNHLQAGVRFDWSPVPIRIYKCRLCGLNHNFPLSLEEDSGLQVV